MSLLADIESFIACLGMSVKEFEAEAGTPGLVSRLKRGAQPRCETELRARDFMESETSDALEHLSNPSSGGSAA